MTRKLPRSYGIIVGDSMEGAMHPTCHDHVGADQSPDEIRESAYRRGFHQALSLVVEGLSSGGSKPDQLGRWLDQVFNWRYRYGKHRRSRSAVVPPPNPPWDDRPYRPLACQSPGAEDAALYVKPGCWCAVCSAGGHPVKVIHVKDQHAMIEWEMGRVAGREYVHVASLRDPRRTPG